MSGSGRGLSNNKYPGLTKLGLILIVPGYLQRSTDRAPEPGDLALLAAALRRCQSTGDLDLELDTAEPGAGLHTDNGDRGPAECAAADPWRLRGSVAGVRAAAGYNITTYHTLSPCSGECGGGPGTGGGAGEVHRQRARCKDVELLKILLTFLKIFSTPPNFRADSPQPPRSGAAEPHRY